MYNIRENVIRSFVLSPFFSLYIEKKKNNFAEMVFINIDSAYVSTVMSVERWRGAVQSDPIM